MERHVKKDLKRPSSHDCAPSQPTKKRPSAAAVSTALASSKFSHYEAALLAVPKGETTTFAELALMATGQTTLGVVIAACRAVKQIPTTSRRLPWWRVIYGGTKPQSELLQPERAKQQARLLQEEGADLSQSPRGGSPRLPRFLACGLGTQVLEAVDQHRYTLLYIHGRGITGRYYVRNPQFFRTARSTGRLRVVLPTSPVKMTGKPLTEWYSSWPPLAGDLEAPRQAMLALLEEELLRLGGRADRLFLGGSSQGCILGLDVYMRFRLPLAGFVGVVGYWPHCSDAVLASACQAGRAARATRPVRLLNGQKDSIVPYAQAQSSFEVMRKRAGLQNVRHTGLDGVDHHLGAKEGRFIRDFLDEVLPPP